ncbi:unnamed protein product, partial [Staurois parvus]
ERSPSSRNQRRHSIRTVHGTPRHAACRDTHGKRAHGDSTGPWRWGLSSAQPPHSFLRTTSGSRGLNGTLAVESGLNTAPTQLTRDNIRLTGTQRDLGCGVWSQHSSHTAY